MCRILRLKCTKFYFDWGSSADPLGKLIKRSHRPPSWILMGLYFWWEGKKKGKGWSKGTRGEGKDNSPLYICLQPWRERERERERDRLHQSCRLYKTSNNSAWKYTPIALRSERVAFAVKKTIKSEQLLWHATYRLVAWPDPEWLIVTSTGSSSQHKVSASINVNYRHLHRPTCKCGS